MIFSEAKTKAIQCLRAGAVQHEFRAHIDEKNLLQCGDLSNDQVARLLNATRAVQHRIEPHAEASGVEVHFFEPESSLETGGDKSRWHIKLYFVEPNVVFISVHKSHVRIASIQSPKKLTIRRAR